MKLEGAIDTFGTPSHHGGSLNCATLNHKSIQKLYFSIILGIIFLGGGGTYSCLL